MPKKPPLPAPKGNKFALGHGCGRPQIYDDAFLEKEASIFLEWMQVSDNVWFEDFAFERGYSPTYFYEWAKRNRVFSEAFEIVQHMQKSKLVKGGLFEQFNPGFTKFVMANACGWYEKTQIAGDSSNPLQFLLEKADGTSKELVNE